MKPSTSPIVPVSWGELLDKISILQIKRARITRPDALRNVETEHNLLGSIGATALERRDVTALFDELRSVNEALWDIEDAIREEEAEARFGSTFIELARSVYRRNDERAALKRQINALMGSELVEEKSYADFADDVAPRPACPHVSGRDVRALATLG